MEVIEEESGKRTSFFKVETTLEGRNTDNFLWAETEAEANHIIPLHMIQRQRCENKGVKHTRYN